jgi:hypothetical protein
MAYLDDNGYHQYPLPPDASSPAAEVNSPPMQFDVFAIASVTCAFFGLFIWQIALAPLAIVLGAIGVHTAGGVRSARRMAVVGYAWGAFDGLLWLLVVSVFNVSSFPL